MWGTANHRKKTTGGQLRPLACTQTCRVCQPQGHMLGSWAKSAPCTDSSSLQCCHLSASTCQDHAGSHLSYMQRVGANVCNASAVFTAAPGLRLDFRICDTSHCLLRQLSQDSACKLANLKPPHACLQPEKVKCPVQAHVGEDDTMDFAKKEVRSCHTPSACS